MPRHDLHQHLRPEPLLAALAERDGLDVTGVCLPSPLQVLGPVAVAA